MFRRARDVIVQRFIHHCMPRRFRYRKGSYSQNGEDLIVDRIFRSLGITDFDYIDIGAHHPYLFSNTALFYERGASGVNIEPDPSLMRDFMRFRPRDRNLGVGVGRTRGEADFFILNVPTLNTFCERTARECCERRGYRIEKRIKVRIDTLSNIIGEHVGGRFPDFLSLDVEGLEMVVLEGIDYAGGGPKVVCAETVDFADSALPKKNLELIGFLEGKGYLAYADTGVNTIFVDRELWMKRRR